MKSIKNLFDQKCRQYNPRLLDFDAEFVTSNTELKLQLRSLPGPGPLPKPKNILISGPSGCGKTILATQAWRRCNQPERSFLVASCERIKNESEILALFRRVKCGDLLLKQFQSIADAHMETLCSRAQDFPLVRIIATQEYSKNEEREKMLFLTRICVPPLKERKEDIKHLVASFLKSRKGFNISHEAMNLLLKQSWQGEVPQLTDILTKSSYRAYAEQRRILLPKDIHDSLHRSSNLDLWLLENLLSGSFHYCLAKKGLRNFIKEFEAVVIASGLLENHGNLSRAAEQLQVPLNTLASKCKSLRRQVESFQNVLALEADVEEGR